MVSGPSEPFGEIKNQTDLSMQEGSSASLDVTVRIGNREETYEVAVHGVKDLEEAKEMLTEVKLTQAVALAVLYAVGESKTERIRLVDERAERVAAEGKEIKEKELPLSQVGEKILAREEKYRGRGADEEASFDKYAHARAAQEIYGVRRFEEIVLPKQEPQQAEQSGGEMAVLITKVKRLSDKVQGLVVSSAKAVDPREELEKIRDVIGREVSEEKDKQILEAYLKELEELPGPLQKLQTMQDELSAEISLDFVELNEKIDLVKKQLKTI